MSIANLITQGIGPQSDIPHLITLGLDIAAMVITTTPDDRIATFDAENRIATFDIEDRVATFDAENRKVIL